MDYTKIPKERRKKIALMLFDITVNVTSSEDYTWVDLFLAEIRRLNKLEVNYLISMIIGVFKRSLVAPTSEQREKARQDIIDAINSGKA